MNNSGVFKTCSACKESKPIDMFSKQNDRKSGVRSQCKDCCKKKYKPNKEKVRIKNKAWVLKNPDKISAQNKRHRDNPLYKDKIKTYMKQYREEHKEELNKNNKWSQIKSLYGLSKNDWELLWSEQNGCCAICGKKFKSYAGADTDHDHKTGKGRGLLCRRCNSAIGQFNDDIELMKLAIKYILKYK